VDALADLELGGAEELAVAFGGEQACDVEDLVFGLLDGCKRV
jgi:hypothetical protein